MHPNVEWEFKRPQIIIIIFRLTKILQMSVFRKWISNRGIPAFILSLKKVTNLIYISFFFYFALEQWE